MNDKHFPTPDDLHDGQTEQTQRVVLFGSRRAGKTLKGKIKIHLLDRAEVNCNRIEVQTPPVIDLWGIDEIQFPRLLAEIAGGIDFNKDEKKSLAESMDVDWEEIAEIFDRAEKEWERIKDKTVPRAS